jgi:hypothetical protein
MLTLFSPSRDHPYSKLLSQIHDAPTIRQTRRYNSSRPMASTSKRFVICEQYRRSICLLVLICTTSDFKINLRQQTRRDGGSVAQPQEVSDQKPYHRAVEGLDSRRPENHCDPFASQIWRLRRGVHEALIDVPQHWCSLAQSPHYRVLESHVDSRSKPVGSLATHDITAHANAATCSTQGGFTSSRVSCGYGREDQILSRHLFILAMLAIFVLLMRLGLLSYTHMHIQLTYALMCLFFHEVVSQLYQPSSAIVSIMPRLSHLSSIVASMT